VTFDVQTIHFVKLFCSCFVKLIFSVEYHAVPFRASELALPRNSECLGMRAFFRGITETVPSLFRGIFSERNSVPNPTHGSKLSLSYSSFVSPVELTDGRAGRGMGDELNNTTARKPCPL
jgi:hypothetical protein